MDYEDNRLKNFEELRRDSKKYGYTEKILNSLENGNFNCLNEIDLEYRNNKAYMEPLLYAVKNSPFGTYEVFKYYGENLQTQDLTMATEIVVNEPDVMEGTVITDNPTLVLYFANINPEIILYISEDLKNDGEFIEELCKTGNTEAIAYAIDQYNVLEVLEDNPNLANNPEFMREAIKEDASVLKYADERLKNDHDFIKYVAMENREVIDYVIEHNDEFEENALTGAREALQEHFEQDVKEEFEKEMKKIENEEKSPENENIISEYNSKDKKVESNDKKADLERHRANTVRIIERMEMDVSLATEGKKNPEVVKRSLARFYNTNIPEKFKKMIEQQIKIMDIEIRKREEKAKSEDKKNIVNINSIEERADAEGVQLDEIHTETGVIRETITKHLEEEKNQEQVNEIAEV